MISQFFAYSLLYVIVYIIFYREGKHSICKAEKRRHIETNADEQQHTFFLSRKNLQNFQKFRSNRLYARLGLNFFWVCGSNLF